MMTDGLFNFIVQTLMQYAYDAIEDEEKDKCEFNSGRTMAYYEVLDTIKNRLVIYEYDLSECGLDVNLEEMFDRRS